MLGGYGLRTEAQYSGGVRHRYNVCPGAMRDLVFKRYTGDADSCFMKSGGRGADFRSVHKDENAVLVACCALSWYKTHPTAPGRHCWCEHGICRWILPPEETAVVCFFPHLFSRSALEIIRRLDRGGEGKFPKGRVARLWRRSMSSSGKSSKGIFIDCDSWHREGYPMVPFRGRQPQY